MKKRPVRVRRKGTSRAARPEVAAVIELGTTSVRMVVAEIECPDSIRTLESVQQPVTLGKDAFTKGSIERSTTEECVKALRSFQHVLREYHITAPCRLRAVATSAVREALNRDAFLDRIFIATGIDVEILDKSEVGRFTYLGVHPLFDRKPSLRREDVLVIEVGGGSTEALLIHRNLVKSSQSYRLGSLRLREAIEHYHEPIDHLREIMEGHIASSINSMKKLLTLGNSPFFLALGGDARFASSQIASGSTADGLATVKVSRLASLTEQILKLSVDDLVHRYHMSYPEAETLGPALLAYVRLAQALRIRELTVGSTTLRDGILREMATPNLWTEEFESQIVNSALEMGKRYEVDASHARRVADLCRLIFHALREEHHLGRHYELLLSVAALLHDSGTYVSNRAHHKHSMYLIMNCDIFGLSGKDLRLAALVARYHRKSQPRPIHEEYATLDREGRVAVSKLAAILRVADGLDRARADSSPQMTLERGKAVISIEKAADLTLARHALREKAEMFEEVYGMPLELRHAGR